MPTRIKPHKYDPCEECGNDYLVDTVVDGIYMEIWCHDCGEFIGENGMAAEP